MAFIRPTNPGGRRRRIPWWQRKKRPFYNPPRRMPTPEYPGKPMPGPRTPTGVEIDLGIETETKPERKPVAPRKETKRDVDDMRKRRAPTKRRPPSGGTRRPATKRRRQRSIHTKVRPRATGSSFSYYKKARRSSLTGMLLKKLTPIQTIGTNESERLYSTPPGGGAESTGVGRQCRTSFKVLDAPTLSGYSSIASSNVTRRVYIREVTSRLMFTNQENVNTFVDIYDLEPRAGRMCSLGPGDAWKQGLKDQGSILTDPTTQINTSPFYSGIFTEFYKVNKVTHIELEPGRSHLHISKFALNKLYNQELYERNPLGTGATYIPGYTHFTMIVAYGAPINDATDRSLVSTGPVAIDLVRSEVVKLQFLLPTEQTYGFADSLPAIPTPKVQDAGDSVVENTGSA